MHGRYLVTAIRAAVERERKRCLAAIPPCRKRGRDDDPCDRCDACTARRTISGCRWDPATGEWQ